MSESPIRFLSFLCTGLFYFLCYLGALFVGFDGAQQNIFAKKPCLALSFSEAGLTLVALMSLYLVLPLYSSSLVSFVSGDVTMFVYSSAFTLLLPLF